ncbi:hypothetical protein [Rufibacter quisquiliarum]|uniref:Uncharacterized protein n=1 Tax=Rufibacter quisquiliarum TaxID=1549639 RepID=A0A839GR03_9BACT|nr:hypothetical protein [Rufibacter quisquiliarum]MBA9077935.1 hypothetical protein [Rufibacter quisquiliarum]
MRRTVLWVQGIFYILTGIWPLLHMPSFLAVTGPKNEVWLVVTVGILVMVVGATFIASALQKRVERSVGLLGFFCAAGLAAIDMRYAFHDVILNVYLLDAAAEVVLAGLWVYIFLTDKLSD